MMQNRQQQNFDSPIMLLTKSVYLMKKAIYSFLTYIFIAGFGITSVLAMPNKSASKESFFSRGIIHKLQNEDIEEFLKKAFELYKQKRYEESLAICAKAELSPKDFRPHSIIGFVYLAHRAFL